MKSVLKRAFGEVSLVRGRGVFASAKIFMFLNIAIFSIKCKFNQDGFVKQLRHARGASAQRAS